MKQKILFHVGLHKTGTTSLQQNFFVAKNKFLQHPKGRRIWLPIFVNKFSTEQLGKLDRRIIQNFSNFSKSLNLTPVISNERLSGYPISGGYDRLSIYTRISSLDLDVKILFIIREQKEWLYSAWRQMITDGGSISLKEFLQQKPLVHNVRRPGARFEYLNYYMELRKLNELFGSENVLVYPMELIFSDFDNFKRRISMLLEDDFTKIDKKNLPRLNERKTLSEFYAQWFLNNYVLSSPASPGGLISDQTKIGARIRFFSKKLFCFLPEIPFSKKIIETHKAIIAREVGDYYVGSNKLASQALGINLAEIGYDA